MIDHGINVWDTAGRQLMRLDDYSMRVLGYMSIPRMTEDSQMFYHGAAKASGVRTVLCATGGYGFFMPFTVTGFNTEMGSQFLEDGYYSESSPVNNYHDRPFITLYDGAFAMDLAPGTKAYNLARGVPYTTPPMFVWFFTEK